MGTGARSLAPFGVEIDLDLADPCNDADVARTLRAHGLAVFRDQAISLEQQARVMSALGPVLRHWTGMGYVSNVREDGMLGDRELCFHSDMAYTPMPFLAISLHAVEVSPGSTSTRYASAIRAYEKLPLSLRDELDGREILNVFPLSGRPEGYGERNGAYPPDVPRVKHPVLALDPITERRVVMASEMMSDEIVGLDRRLSNGAIEEMFATLYAEDNIYEHHWRNGDVVIWANIGVQHARSALESTQPRTLQRVCIAEGPIAMYEPDDKIRYSPASAVVDHPDGDQTDA